MFAASRLFSCLRGRAAKEVNGTGMIPLWKSVRCPGSDPAETQCSKLGRPRSETARQAILCAASGLLARDGFAGVTMEAIAARAGVSKATLYRWWPNKSAVLMEAFLAATAPCCAAPDTGDVRNDLRQRMRGLAQAFSGRLGTIIARHFGGSAG